VKYKGYHIERRDPVEKGPKNKRRRGILAIRKVGNSDDDNYVTYTVGNTLSRTSAYWTAKRWIDQQVQDDEV